MEENKPWWDLGHQAQRVNHAFWKHHGYDTNTGKPATQMMTQPAIRYDAAKGPLSPAAYGEQPKYDTNKGPLSIEAYEGKPLKPTPAAGLMDNPAIAYGKGVSAIQGHWGDLYKRASNQVNPYADGASLLGAFNQSDANVTKQFANAERRGQEGLAARGMMGSGQEAGLMNVIAAERANAISNGRNALQSQWADKSNAWQQNQDSTLAAILNGQYGALGGYVTQAELPGRLDEQTIRNKALEKGLSEADIRLTLMKYEASDAAWDRANPWQAFARDFGIAAAGGAGQAIGTAAARLMGVSQ